jgi:hypothetical protein
MQVAVACNYLLCGCSGDSVGSIVAVSFPATSSPPGDDEAAAPPLYILYPTNMMPIAPITPSGIAIIIVADDFLPVGEPLRRLAAVVGGAVEGLRVGLGVGEADVRVVLASAKVMKSQCCFPYAIRSRSTFTLAGSRMVHGT